MSTTEFHAPQTADASTAQPAPPREPDAPAAPQRASEPRTGTVTLPFARAINLAMRHAMEDDSKVLLMGEDIGKLGGVFRVTEHLQRDFGPGRVRDTPLAESGILGTAIGMAFRGYRSVCEIQFEGFIFPAFDQITTQLSRITRRHEGRQPMPIVIRVPYGGYIGSIEHHEESPEAYFAHTPGLRVVAPSTPNDAYWMMRQALTQNDPVLYFEPKSRYWHKGEVNLDRPAAGLHDSVVAKTGTDVTVVGYGGMTTKLLQAAALAESEGISVEVVDLRSVAPIDYGPLLNSVRKTGRLVVGQEAPGNVSVASEIAATVSERAFFSLEAPVLRVTGFNTPFPPSKVESVYLPDPDRILDAVDRVLEY